MKIQMRINCRRGMALWPVLIGVSVLALAAGWVVARQMNRAAVQEQADVLRLKVPPLPPPVVVQEAVVEDIVPADESGMVAGLSDRGDSDGPKAPLAPQTPEVGDMSTIDDPVDAGAPDPPADENASAGESPAPSPTDRQGVMSLQVAAFLSRTNAENHRDALNTKGYAAYLHERTDAQQRTWHTVRIGAFSSRGEAVQALERFNKEENASAIIVRSP